MTKMEKKNFQWMGALAIFFLVVLLIGFSTEGRAAEKFPNRTISVVSGYAPGSLDITIKVFTERMGPYLGQAMPIIYKPGAAGSVGTSFVAKAKPDGYTLLGTTQTGPVTNPLTKPGLDYAMDDLVPICRLVIGPALIAVRSDSPWKTMKDLVDYAQKNPEKITYSTSGVWSTPHVRMEKFLKVAKVKFTHVPTTGSTPAMTALLGGHVDVTDSGMNTLNPHIASGAFRPLATSQSVRLAEFPDVPTLLELGYGESIPAWYGLFAPKNTPKQIINVIYGAAKGVIDTQMKEIEETGLKRLGLVMAFLNPEEFAAQLRKEHAEMKELIDDLEKTKK
jgi:tripartite-type tricarboxylate transporter receptor subunit TctC